MPQQLPRHTRWEIETGGPGEARAIFPVGFDRSNLVDITGVLDCWKRFVNRTTGEVVDTAKFYATYLEECEVDRGQ